jgi:hypothetical protein
MELPCAQQRGRSPAAASQKTEMIVKRKKEWTSLAPGRSKVQLAKETAIMSILSVKDIL